MIKNSLYFAKLFFLVTIIFVVIGCKEKTIKNEEKKAFDKPPNLLLILVDDLGYGDLASYGHHIVKTPNIDKIAKEGIKYTQYYAPSPLCSPSRAGLLTGRMPYRTGIRSWIPDHSDVHIGENEITLAHLLKAKGYDTAVMGKLHLNGGVEMINQPQAKDMGFDYSFVIPGGWAKNSKVESENSNGRLRRGKIFPDNYWRNGEPVGITNKFSGALVADEISTWLDKQEKEHPFFIYASFSEVHVPISSPKKYLNMYDDYITDTAKDDPYLFHMEWSNQPHRGQGEYYANISFMDAQVGKIIEKLKAINELDNTIIIFTSDNGPVTREARKKWELNMAGETNGLRGRKGDVFEGGIRVPAIVSYPPKIKAGQTSHEPIYGLDWLPTLAELMDFEIPQDRVIDGQSVVNSMVERDVVRNKPMIWGIDYKKNEEPDEEWAIREKDWLLIFDREEQPKYLFNIAVDPYQVSNLLEKRDDIVEPLFDKFIAYKNNIESDSVNKPQKDLVLSK